MRTLFTASLIALSALGAASAQTGSASIEVGYDAGDLATTRGQEEVRNDIRRAARRICDIPGAHDSDALRAERACVDAAVERASLQLNFRLAEARDGAGVIRVAAG